MKINKKIGKLIAGCALAMVLSTAIAIPAHADIRRGHVEADRRWRPGYRAYPGHYDVYAPPVIYSPPPPVSPGLNLIVPLNFH